MKASRISMKLKAALAFSILGVVSAAYTVIWEPQKPTAGINQSYMLFADGTLGVTKSYFANDDELKMSFPNHIFKLARDVKVAKANYFVDDNDVIYAVDAHGFIYEKDRYQVDLKKATFGGNYFITRKGIFNYIRHDGMIGSYEQGDSDYNLNDVKLAGGNYFIVPSKKDKKDKLMVTTFQGYYVDQTQYFHHKLEDIKVKGNNYFITTDGTVYTTGTVLMTKFGADGKPVLGSDGKSVALLDNNGNKQYFASLKKFDAKKYPTIKVAGGNFFIDNDNNIHTIDVEGLLDLNVVDRKIKVQKADANGNVEKDYSKLVPVSVGNNYLVYADGAVFMVARDGYYYYVTTLDKSIAVTSFALDK
jgi:hypothetical protein